MSMRIQLFVMVALVMAGCLAAGQEPTNETPAVLTDM